MSCLRTFFCFAVVTSSSALTYQKSKRNDKPGCGISHTSIGKKAICKKCLWAKLRNTPTEEKKSVRYFNFLMAKSSKGNPTPHTPHGILWVTKTKPNHFSAKTLSPLLSEKQFLPRWRHHKKYPPFWKSSHRSLTHLARPNNFREDINFPPRLRWEDTSATRSKNAHLHTFVSFVRSSFADLKVVPNSQNSYPITLLSHPVKQKSCFGHFCHSNIKASQVLHLIRYWTINY